MAKENPLDDFPDASPLSGEETDIDQQVDGLRGVLKKDAGELPIVDDDSAGGANMADFGSDFGSDFAAEPEAGGLNDPFGLEDTGAEADFPAPGSDLAATSVRAPETSAAVRMRWAAISARLRRPSMNRSSAPPAKPPGPMWCSTFRSTSRSSSEPAACPFPR